MKTREEVMARLEQSRLDREQIMRPYLEKVLRDDMHGVMDASADIRELAVEIATLEWVLG